MKNGKILLRICLLILVTSTIASFWAISTPVTPQMTAQAAVGSNLPDSCTDCANNATIITNACYETCMSLQGNPTTCANYAACCAGQYCATHCSLCSFCTRAPPCV